MQTSSTPPPAAQAELFVDHTVDSAPPDARRTILATRERLGYLPSAVARMASSPQLLNTFLRSSAAFEATSLDPVAREVLIMTIAVRNRCQVCVAMHTAALARHGADEVARALRTGAPLVDPRLQAIRRFTEQVMDDPAAVRGATLAEFLGHGFTPRHALEVVLGIGVYTMSTLANRMTGAPLDEPLRRFAWDERTA